MPTPEIDIHRRVLAALMAEKEALLKQLADLEAVVQFHAKRVGGELSSNGDVVVIQELPKAKKLPATTTKHDAAAIALRELARPAKIGDIADVLLRMGYGDPTDRRLLFNGYYTALKRRDDMFEAVGDAMWKLKDTPRKEDA